MKNRTYTYIYIYKFIYNIYIWRGNINDKGIEMKNVVLTIVGFAIAIGLILGVIVPLASHGRQTGINSNTNMSTSDTRATELADPIYPAP